jgi:hypothetical protein
LRGHNAEFGFGHITHERWGARTFRRAPGDVVIWQDRRDWRSEIEEALKSQALLHFIQVMTPKALARGSARLGLRGRRAYGIHRMARSRSSGLKMRRLQARSHVPGIGTL